MARKRVVKLPKLPALSGEQLAQLKLWMDEIAGEFRRGQDQCRKAFRLSGLDSVRRNADYYTTGISIVAALKNKITEEQRRQEKYAQGEDSVSGDHAGGGI